VRKTFDLRLYLARFRRRDFVIKKLVSQSPQHSESVFSAGIFLFGLGFGIMGALTNYFLSIPFYGYFSLYFGQILVLLCLVTRGLNAGIIASVISATALAVKLDDPFLFIILVSETFVVHMMLRNGKTLLLADAIYWLFIGVPLTLLLLILTSATSSELLIISGLTLSINGIFGASLAALIYSFLPIKNVYKKYRVKPPKLATVIFSLCMLTVTLPTIIISLIFTWQNIDQKEQEIANTLTRQSEQIMYVVDAFVDSHLAAVNTLATTFPNSDFSLPVQTVLNATAFYEYVITDKNNMILFASPKLELVTLSQFSYQPSENLLIDKIPELTFQNNKYLYYQSITQHEWTITVLTSPNIVTQVISKNFYILAACLFITFVVFAIIANQLSKRITLPLVNLANHFNDSSASEDMVSEAEISDEMKKVTDKLINSREIMLNFQQHLSLQVQDKTKQLTTLNNQLYNLAQKDGLTNLLNRSGFDDLANTTFRNCVRNHIPLSMVLIDIDDFKQINDTYGHPFGDTCIISISKTFNRFCKRTTDLLGRYGGEEFIILLSGGDIEEHHELTKRIHRAVQKTKVSSEDIVVRMTISIGVSSMGSNYGMSFEGLVKSADEQLYKSKRTGKNKISIYSQ
jgi:diguanylate cyclase (GGDEF)-like protein